MKFARILLLLVVVLCLLGSATVDAAKKKKKKSKGKAKVTTDHLESVLNQAEQADKKAKPTPEEAQANLNAAIEKAEKQAEADEALEKAKEANKPSQPAVDDAPKEVKKGKKKSKDWSKITEADLEKAWERGDDEEELTHEYDHSQKVIEKKKKQVRKEQIRKAQAKAKKAGGKGKNAPTVHGDDVPDDWMPPLDMTDLDAIAEALAAQDEKMGGMLDGGMPGVNGLGIGANLKPGDDLDALNSFTGTAMYFVDLTPVQPDGKKKGQPWDKKTVDDLAGYWASMLKSGHLGANVYNLGALNKDGQMLLSIDKGWQTREILTFIFQQPAVVKLTKDRQEFTPEMFRDPDDDDDL